VANAVLDGTDAVMLSAETAVGDHPVRVVEAMDRIVREAERSGEYAELREQRVPDAGAARTEALARSARYLARDVDASAVVVATESGYTARTAAKFRPGVPVVAATPDDRVRRRLALSWGLHAVQADLDAGSVQGVIETATGVALDAGVVESGETVVVLSGVLSDVGGADTANTLKVHVAAEALAVGRTVVSGRATGPVARAPDGDLRDVPAGAVLVLDAGFDAELTGETARLAAIVAADDSTTGYPAIVARELGVPMVCGARLDAPPGARVTVDGERGVIYEGAVGRR
jgi:pyruvate kinase